MFFMTKRFLPLFLCLASALSLLAQGHSDALTDAIPDDPTPQQSSSAPSTQTQLAEKQIHEQEQQRVLGVVPSFNISYRPDAVSLTRKQKMSLAFHAAVDPIQFAEAFATAGYKEAMDKDTGFGWGAEGLGKRAGAAYLDSFDGAILGNGILPSLLHQDPRYFRRGYGSITHRTLYAAAAAFICKHDNTNRWEPNYSNVGGNILSGAISNLYYPKDSSSGFSQAISDGMLVTVEGSLGSIFQEFWPDVSRKFLHRDPTHGIDAEMAAERAAAHKN